MKTESEKIGILFANISKEDVKTKKMPKEKISFLHLFKSYTKLLMERSMKILVILIILNFAASAANPCQSLFELKKSPSLFETWSTYFNPPPISPETTLRMNGDRNIIPIIKNDERIQNVIGFSKARYEARNYSIDTKASPETSKELIKDIFGIESQSLGLRILSFLFFPDEIRMELSKRSIWDVEAVHLSITISKDSVVLSAQLDEFNSKKLKRYKNKLNSDQGLLRRFVGGGKYSHTYEYSEGSGEGLSFTPIRMYSHQIEIPYDCFTGFMLELKAFNSTP